MASTGLLAGVNPYRGGNVAIDFTSKPLQILLQMQQKQQAKAEAINKYYKDYEKSLNSAGLTPEEQKIFTNKLNEVKGFAIKNKEKLTNPSKYGYDTQATVDAGFRELSNYISGAKQAGGERKAFKTIHDKAIAEGKHVSPNYLDIWGNAMKPYGAGYVAPALDQIRIYDAHNDIDFVDKTWKGINLPGDIINEKEFINNKETGKIRPVMVESITGDVAKAYDQKARGYFRSNEGTQEQYNILFQDKDFVNQLNPVFKKYLNKDISNAEDLLVAQGLSSKVPNREAKGVFEIPDPTWMEKFNLQQGAINSRADKNQDGEYSPEVQVDEIFEAGKGDKIDINIEGKKISGRRVQLPADIEGKFDRKIGNTKFSPDYFVMSEDKLNLYPVFVTGKTKYGSDILGGEGGTKLNEKIPVKTSLVPALGKAYGGQSWTKKNLFSDGKTPKTAPPKSETWAERQARLKKKK